jgi:Ca2+-binding EF-hand superfamily protein
MVHFGTDFNLLSIFTDQQIENYVDTFNEIDTNGNGFIEFGELNQYVIDHLPADSEFTTEQLQETFDLIDTNHNGVLKLDEFFTFLVGRK